jgi:hypothetical protein
MLDAEPLEVAAVQGGKLRPVKQQPPVVLSHFTSHSPGTKAGRRSESANDHLLASFANQESDSGTGIAIVSPTDSMLGPYDRIVL